MTIRINLWLLAILLCNSLYAKNLDSRLGFGVTYHDLDNTSAMSLRYHISQYVTAQFVLGFDTSDSKSATVLGIKLYRNAYLEENLNFYVGMAGYVIADNNSGTQSVASGFEFSGLLGTEFFLSGLPNLGFQFETGIAIRTLRKITSKTFGGALATAGIHYYF